jgi:gliding motility-associated-like protein
MFPLKPGLYLSVLLTLTFLGPATTGSAQVVCTPVYLNEYLGTSNTPLQPHALKALPDGTTLIVGRAAQPGSTTYDGWISRWSITGTPIWSYYVGGTGNDDLTGITQLNDGTYIAYGTTTSFGHPEGKGWLIRIDGNGNVLWSCQLGSTTTSTDRIKAVQQYSNGDLIGTLNMNDSSAASDPVVFRLALDGTLSWTHRFDNGGDDSYTTLALEGDTVYAGGYYTAAGMQQGVISELNAVTGALLQSQTISNGDATLNGQVTGLEIYNNEISYGLYVTKGVAGLTATVNAILLIQTDLAGHTRSVAYDNDPHLPSLMTCKRTADTGFYVLRVNNALNDLPSITKVSWYGNLDWIQSMINATEGTINFSVFSAFDMTPDGGVIAAGHYFSYLTPVGERLQLNRLTFRGEAGACNLSYDVTYVSAATMSQTSFTWAAQPAFTPLVTLPTPISASDPPAVLSTGCSSTVCLDQTPIPSGCGKTFNIQYLSAERTLLRDALPMPDGGKVAVGDYNNSTGLVTRFQSDGAIAWTRNFDVSGDVMQFRRILQTADGNLLVIGTHYYNQNNYAFGQLALLKLDLNGNTIWCHYYALVYSELADAAATPDNGFVVACQDGYGSPTQMISWAARFDANANLIWKRDLTHGALNECNKAIACSQDAVFIAYETYLSEPLDRFGVDRLDLNTGNLVYSQLLTAGANTTARMNGVFTVNDTAYVFIYRYINGVTNNMMAGLDPQGNLFRALALGTDQVNPSPNAPQTWLDNETPSVTMTPDLDFWLASRVTVNGIQNLEVTRFQRDGTVELNKLHTGITGYLPMNVRPQGKGLVVVGQNPATKTGDPDFTTAFVLKLDSSGQLQTGAAANCVATDRPITVSSWPDCAPATFPYGPSTGVPGYTPTSGTLSPYNQDNDLTAVLDCFLPGTCNAVNVLQKGVACALLDTLVYFLDNSANCGAAATWSYDTSYFRPGLISGDSIQLIALKSGATSVTAQVEGYCQFFTQPTPANITFTSTRGLGLAADTMICSEGPITLHVTPGFTTYLWSDNSTADSLIVSSTGQYSVTATSSCGTRQATVTVTDANALFHATPDTIRCNTDIDSLRATGGYTGYQWSPAYDLVADSNLALASPDVATTYTVTARRSPGCTVTAKVSVSPLTSPAISLPNDGAICFGDSLLLDAGAGFDSYQWSTGAATEQIYVHSPATYSVQAYYPNGCVSRAAMVLDSVDHPRPLLDTSSVVCLGQPRTLTPAGGPFASYLWSDGSTGSSLVISAVGTYWVLVTDAQGCPAADTTQITGTAMPPTGFLVADTAICQYGDLKLTTSQPYDSYSWSDLTSLSTITIQHAGVYWVTVTDANGCTGTDTVTVSSKQCLVGLFVPNAFTPDGDGHNDLFRPLIYGEMRLLEFAVYDRWGQRVFETKTPLAGWDGRVGGNAAAAGTYVWYCSYQMQGGPVTLQKGTVILIR